MKTAGVAVRRFGEERKDLIDHHACEIVIALHDRDATRLEVELFQRSECLKELQLIEEVVFEPEHDLFELLRAAKLCVAS